MKSSCISHPANERLVVIRKWQVDFCDDNHCAAALLSYIEYFHNWKVKTDNYNKHLNDIAQMHGDERIYSENVYQFHTLEDYQEALLNLYARNAIIEAIKLLEAKGAVSIHTNPNLKYTFDKKKYYQFHPEICNKWIKQKYNINGELDDLSEINQNDSSKSENKRPSSENQLSTFENKPTAFEKGRSITEINNKDINNTNNESDDFCENEEKKELHEEGKITTPDVINALTAKGFSAEHFKYPDSAKAVKELIQAGATVEHFEKALELAKKATSKRNAKFNLRYLATIIENSISQEKNIKTFNKTLTAHHTTQENPKPRTYENDVKKCLGWIADIEIEGGESS